VAETKSSVSPSRKTQRAAAILVAIVGWARPAAASGSFLQSSAPTKDAGADLDAQTWFQTGQAAMQAGDLRNARAAFRHVLALDPKAAAAYVNLGVIAMRQKEWEEALRNLRTAEKLAPKMSGVRLNIGLVEYRQENYAAAIAPFESVLRDDPASVQARYLLGLCLTFTEKYAKAAATLEPLWTELSGDILYLYVLGMAANLGGNQELDQKAMRRLVEVGGDSPELHLILGKAHIQRQEYPAAVEELQKAVHAKSDLPYAHFNLGMAYAKQGEYEKSAAEFQKDIQVEPDLADNYEQLAQLYSRQQRDDDLNARSATAWYVLAKVHDRRKEYAQALKAIDAAGKFAPSNQNVLILRAQILLHLGRTAEAKAEFEKAKNLVAEGEQKDREALGEKMLPSPELKQSVP
jgi:tetratricopeptide (TPR) repeat protein